MSFQWQFLIPINKKYMTFPDEHNDSLEKAYQNFIINPLSYRFAKLKRSDGSLYEIDLDEMIMIYNDATPVAIRRVSFVL